MTIVHIVLFEFKPTLSRETVVHVSKDSEHVFQTFRSTKKR